MSTTEEKDICKLTRSEPIQFFPEELYTCKNFAQNSCCNQSHSKNLLSSPPFYLHKVLRAASLSNSNICANNIQKLNCFPCHPEYGLEKKQYRNICQGLCDHVFKSCANQFYKLENVRTKSLEGFYHPKGQIPVPCDEDEVICTELNAFFDNGTYFCQAFGLEVERYIVNTTEYEYDCYDGRMDQTMYGKIVEHTEMNFMDQAIGTLLSPFLWLYDAINVDFEEKISNGEIDIETLFLQVIIAGLLLKFIVSQFS
eukprot:snap_masked-scaffold_6-processed-gene-16.38-mRNA-1 protein AED:1.00 eAED:1.00 QI:0/-1/0/0/-1/1/1/0/254